MERIVNRAGNSSLTVSLPSKWIKKHRVSKGDSMRVEERGNRLIIYPSSSAHLSEIKEIEIANLDYQFTKLTLNNIFRLGYNKVKIGFNSLAQFEHVQELSNDHMIGFEVTKKAEEYCIIENVVEPDLRKSDLLLRRIFMIIEESLSMVSSDLNGGNLSLASYLRQQFNKVDQFANLFMRNINQERYSEKMCVEYLLVHKLLVLEAELLHMYEYIDGCRGSLKVSSDVAALADNMLAAFRRFQESFYGKDFKMLAEVNLIFKRLLYEDVYAGLKKNDNAIIFYHLGVFLRVLTYIISPALGIIEC